MGILISIIVWTLLIGGIIYFAIKRHEEKKKENFEDRDN